MQNLFYCPAPLSWKSYPSRLTIVAQMPSLSSVKKFSAFNRGLFFNFFNPFEMDCISRLTGTGHIFEAQSMLDNYPQRCQQMRQHLLHFQLKFNGGFSINSYFCIFKGCKILHSANAPSTDMLGVISGNTRKKWFFLH